MGATSITEFGTGRTVHEVFQDLRQDAQHEHGHRYDSGTIGAAGSYAVLNVPPMLKADALRLAESLLEANDPRVRDKHGPILAIPVVTAERTEQAVRIPEFLADSRESAEAKQERLAPLALEALRKARKLRRGEKVLAVRVWGYSYERSPHWSRQWGQPVRHTAKWTDLHCEVTIAKPKSRLTKAALASATADAWVFVGTVPC